MIIHIHAPGCVPAAHVSLCADSYTNIIPKGYLARLTLGSKIFIPAFAYPCYGIFLHVIHFCNVQVKLSFHPLSHRDETFVETWF
jgi:hypothetical protein